MKQYILKIIYLAPIPLLLVSINYFIDPAHLFDPGYEEGIAKHLLGGMNVTNVYNYDERLLQKHYIDGLQKAPEVVVLGSSRIMLLGSRFFPGNRLVNNGVSGGQIEDLMAMINLYRKNNMMPKRFVFGLDPWMLNDHNGEIRWLSLRDEYIDMARKLAIDVSNLAPASRRARKYRELVSLDYFQTSLKTAFIDGMSRYAPTKQIQNNGATRLTDGSICYDIKYRTRTPVEVDLLANSYINLDPLYQLGAFSHLSGRKIEQLERLIDYLVSEKIDIVLFLAPYHPKVYHYLNSNERYKMVSVSEYYYKALAKQKKLAIFGSFGPNTYKLDGSFFYDGMHFKEEAIPILLKPS